MEPRSAPTGSCPPAGAFHNEGSPQVWTAANLGEVFGVTVDRDSNPNIYVAATTVYGNFPPAREAMEPYTDWTAHRVISVRLPSPEPATPPWATFVTGKVDQEAVGFTSAVSRMV